MHITRRNALRGAAILPLAAMLNGCGSTLSNAAQTISVTQAMLTAFGNVVAGFQKIETLLPSGSTSVLETIDQDVAKAEGLFGGLNVGALVPVTSASSLLADLTVAANTAASLLPGNVYVEAVQAVLAGISLASAAAGALTARAAPAAGPMATLAALPYHGAIKR